jgi:hypothetical protein
MKFTHLLELLLCNVIALVRDYKCGIPQFHEASKLCFLYPKKGNCFLMSQFYGVNRN